jgi:uncharacterized membrane protein
MSWLKSPAHAAFQIGILFKGLDGAAEIVGAVLLYLVPPDAISQFISTITQHELSEDRHDFIASHLKQLSERLSPQSQAFAAAYLLIHGVVKVLLVWALQARKLWAYPTAIWIFGAFGVYQMYRYFVSPSFAMIALTVLDAAVIVLTWMEYGRLKREASMPGAAAGRRG